MTDVSNDSSFSLLLGRLLRSTLGVLDLEEVSDLLLDQQLSSLELGDSFILTQRIVGIERLRIGRHGDNLKDALILLLRHWEEAGSNLLRLLQAAAAEVLEHATGHFVVVDAVGDFLHLGHRFFFLFLLFF